MRKRSSTSPRLAVTLLPAPVARRPMKKKANGKERRKQELEALPRPTTKSNVPQMILKRLHNNSVRLKD